MSERGGPRGSELVVQDWLQGRPDLVDVRFVGDAGPGPPDFVAEFRGQEVAIEVKKMPLGMGWPEKRRRAFQTELQQVVQSVKDDPKAPRLHVLCTTDPRQPEPPKRNGAWKGRLRAALLAATGAGALQLMAEGERVGRGVVVKWLPASNEGSLPLVNHGGGYLVVATAAARIAEEVAAKAVKVQRSERARAYSNWWLILEDEVVLHHAGLSPEEWQPIRDAVAASEDIAVWSKVILVSRWNGDWTAVYERPGEPGLD